MGRRHIEFERLHNFRDLGGYPGLDGRTVAWGRLYRSGSPATMTADDRERFLALGVSTVIDLRYPWEIAAKGRVLPAPGLRYVNLSIEHRPYDQATIDPSRDPWRYLADRFAEVLEDGAGEIRQVLEILAAAEGPAVFHCASGKDRTGLIAALVLSTLGVPDEHVLADFALTERATSRLVADWKAAHPGRELRWPAYGRAPARIMELTLADLRSRYGSVEGYLREIGVGGDVVAGLRGRSLVF